MGKFLKLKIYLAGFLISIYAGLKGFLDNDSFWHLKYGELLLDNIFFDRRDTWSFLSSNQEWYYPGWLPEYLFAIFGKLNHVAFEGVFFLFFVIMGLTIIFLYLTIKNAVHPFVSIILVLIVAEISLPFWTVRSFIFTKLLLIVSIFVYEKTIKRNRPFGILILFGINVLWINSHADFLFFIVLPLWYTTVFIAEHQQKKYFVKSVVSDKRIIYSLSVIFLSIFTICFTPFGINTITKIYSFFTASNLTDVIVEWQKLGLKDISFYPFYGSFLLFVLLLVYVYKKYKKAEKQDAPYTVILILLFLITLQSRRFLYYYAIFYPLVLSYFLNFTPINEYAKKISQIFPSKILSISILLTIFVSAFFFTKNTVIPNFTFAFYSKYSNPLTPYDALLFLNKNNIKISGNIFNSFNNGAFITYYFPEAKISIDSRAGVYSRDTFDLWLNIANDKKNYKDKFDEWNIQYIWLDNDQGWGIISKLKQDASYQLLYESPTSIIFTKTK